ncbi:MAG: type II secretion system protein [Candidatus Nomurabacteria bacterium]|nr:type II secretion system protein [Candidatus Nomurabacteria bacterium]
MTYIELIVVLSIFAIMSSIVIFNYEQFQAKVDVKNLASDIALKIVEAQKSALDGQLPSLTQQSQIDSTWKPSYGVYFDLSTDSKSFIYFTDLNNINNNPGTQNSQYDGTSSCNGECIDKILITRNDSISQIASCTGSPIVCTPITNPFSVSFSRPSSTAVFFSNTTQLVLTGASYIQITIKSPKTASATIKVYPSGRIQVD